MSTAGGAPARERKAADTARPRWTLGLALLAVLALAPGLARLELDTDGAALVPADDPAVREDAALRARFDLRDLVVVAVESRTLRGVFEPRLLELVRRLSAAFVALDGVGPEHVDSLATEGSDRVRTGTLEFRRWLDTPEGAPFDEAGAARLRADLEPLGIYDGTLLARGQPAPATAILVGVPPGADRRAFARALEAAVERAVEPADLELAELHVVGAPLAEALLGDHLSADLARLVPLAVLVLALVFGATFRSLPGVLLPLAEVGAALVGTFGAMGWLGVPVRLTHAVVPVILTAVGVADELHLIGAFVRRRAARPDEPRAAAAAAVRRALRWPVVATSATTAIGFAAFTLSPLPAVRSFGALMVAGVALCCAWSLWVVPACFALIPDERWGAARTARRLEGLGARAAALGLALRQRRAAALGAALALFALAGLGAARLEVRDSWLGGFAPESALRRSSARVDELFGGTHLLQLEVARRDAALEQIVPADAVRGDTLRVTLPAGRDAAQLVGLRLELRMPGSTVLPGGIEMPALERTVVGAAAEGDGARLELAPLGPGSTGGITNRAATREVEDWVPTHAEQLEVRLSPREALLSTEALRAVGALEAALAARAAERVGRVVGLHEHLTTMRFMLHGRNPSWRGLPESVEEAQLVLDHYVRVRGAARLARLLDDERSATLMTVFLRGAESDAVSRLLAAVEELRAAHLEPVGLSLRVGGDVARSQAAIAAIVSTQTRSLAFAVLGVALCAGLLFRSLRLGLCCALPAALAVLVDLAGMGALGVPLGVATSMFASMTIGIGVDYAIHLLHRWRRADGAGAAAVAEALAEVAPVVVLDALALGLSFAVLCASSVPANARLGLLMVASLATCLAATLTLLPLLVGQRPEARGSAPRA